MNFTKHKEQAGDLSAYGILALFSKEQREALDEARRQYDLWRGDGYRYEDLEGEGAQNLADEEKKDECLKTFYEKYPDSQSFSFHLKLLVEGV